MAEHPSLARPSLVDGMRLATARDIPRLLWWQAKGYAFGARRGPATSRIISATTLALLAIPPFLLIAAAAMLWQVVGPRRSDWHMTDDAVMAVAVTKKGWTLHSHGCARPGSGAGAALRDAVMPTWTAEADTHHVPIHISATTERLAEIYAADIPGLRVVGKEWPRGLAMRREPFARHHRLSRHGDRPVPTRDGHHGEHALSVVDNQTQPQQRPSCGVDRALT